MAGISERNGATRKRAHSLEIEARKAKIGELLVRGMSITAIAAEVKVNKSTVSRYVTDLQESTSRYLYDTQRMIVIISCCGLTMFYK